MSVTRLSDPVAATTAVLAKLTPADVLIVGDCRITVSLDASQHFWIEGPRGHVIAIERGRGVAAKIRRALAACPTAP